MPEFLKSIDTQLFFLINGTHNRFLDYVMWLASDRFFWIPLYAFFLWMLYRSERKGFWLTLIFVILIILVSDQLCNIVKNSVMRLRPSNEPALKDLVHLVNGYTGGSFGFYSAHASNSFALVTFIFLTVKNRTSYLLPVLLIYTLLISYSRIYLGVHYPGDVATGIIAGILIGYTASVAYQKTKQKLNSRPGKKR